MPEVLCVGLTTLDVTYYGADLPRLGVKVQAESATLAVGGPAANAALAAAALGADVTLCSAVNGRHAAPLAAEQLRDGRVELLPAQADRSLPISSVFIDSRGERTVVSASDNGSVESSGSHRLPDKLEQFASSAGVVLVDGHYPQIAAPALAAARGAGVTTVIDLGSWKAALPELLPLCDVAIASADFAVPHGDMGDYLLAAGVSFVATSHGQDPITWQRQDGTKGSIDIDPVDALDTNGAGDVLHGAFAALVAQGVDEVSALCRAAQIATETCTVRGARVPAHIAEKYVGDR